MERDGTAGRSGITFHQLIFIEYFKMEGE